MQVLQGVSQLQAPLSSSVVTIGNFDGVHRGHQELIARVLRASKRLQATPVAFTFYPHPSRVLHPEAPVARLFDQLDQRERLELLGIEVLVEEPFTAAFSGVSAAEFFENWIMRPLAPKGLVVGHDFAFGHDREGDLEFLKRLCATRGIELEIVSAVVIDDQPVSSTRIRRARAAGDVETAAHLLGRPYYLKGEVQSGEKRGRLIGVPTANLRPRTEFQPRLGVYVSQTRVGAQTFRSITNLGVNPTFHSEPGAPVKAETHIFDFASDLYGRQIRVELLKYLREERKFSGLEELRGQIARDLTEARAYFDAHA